MNNIRVPSCMDFWSMTPDQFNNFRKNYDLPLILSFFKKTLPNFQNWMDQYKISDEFFIQAPHTGEWFLGNLDREFVEYTEDGIVKYIITENFDNKFENLKKHKSINKSSMISFLPYLLWGKRKANKSDFIIVDKLNNTYANSLQYGLWTSTPGGGESRASLLKDFQVLKLGQLMIPDRIDISSRNLDFTDLDFLEIQGEFHGSYATTISFSSCREITINNGGLHHITFNECVTAKFKSVNSRIQDFIFNNCNLYSPVFINSTINGFTISNGQLSEPIFEKTEIQRFQYIPSRVNISFSREADVSRRMRNAFQSIGKRHESREFYYRERCYERKALWSPYTEKRSEFPNRKFTGRLMQLVNYWRNGHFDQKRSLELLIDLALFHFKIWLHPGFLIKTIKYKSHYILSLLEYFLWGYGERPSRIILNILFVISLFSVVYYTLGPTKADPTNSIYFSMVTFTTLGYGDILPDKGYMKIICGIEALCGAIGIGLLIGGFANRSRY